MPVSGSRLAIHFDTTISTRPGVVGGFGLAEICNNQPSSNGTGVRLMCLTRFVDARVPISGWYLFSGDEQFYDDGGWWSWVDGKLEISDDGVRFTPNWFYRIFSPPADVWIAMHMIRSVEARREFLMKIVTIRHSGGDFHFRCHRATPFVEAIKKCLTDPGK